MGVNNRLRRIYHGMRQRCFNENSPSYPNYGGRGITICEDWRYSYDAFEKWALSNGYDNKLSIDRKDVNGNYEPSNCRWTDKKVQGNNKRHYWLPENKGEFVYQGSPDPHVQEEKRMSIKNRLSEFRLSQVWLIHQLAIGGLQTDKTEMSSLLAGTRVGAKSEYILDMSMVILDDYYRTFYAEGM